MGTGNLEARELPAEDWERSRWGGAGGRGGGVEAQTRGVYRLSGVEQLGHRACAIGAHLQG